MNHIWSSIEKVTYLPSLINFIILAIRNLQCSLRPPFICTSFTITMYQSSGQGEPPGGRMMMGVMPTESGLVVGEMASSFLSEWQGLNPQASRNTQTKRELVVFFAFFLSFTPTILLTNSVDGCFIHNTKQFFNTCKLSYNSTQFSHCLPGDSTRSQKLRPQSHKAASFPATSDANHHKSKLVPVLLTYQLSNNPPLCVWLLC